MSISADQIREMAYDPTRFGFPAWTEFYLYKGRWVASWRRANAYHSIHNYRTLHKGRCHKIAKTSARCAGEFRRRVASGLQALPELYLRNPSALPELGLGQAAGELLATLALNKADRGGLSALVAAFNETTHKRGGRIYPARRNYVPGKDGRDTAFQRARKKRPAATLHFRAARRRINGRWVSFWECSRPTCEGIHDQN